MPSFDNTLRAALMRAGMPFANATEVNTITANNQAVFSTGSGITLTAGALSVTGGTGVAVSAGAITVSGASTGIAVNAGGVTVSAGAVTLSPANANVTLSPTGTGVVTINPATAGTMNNMAIGSSFSAQGTFSVLATSSLGRTLSAARSVDATAAAATSTVPAGRVTHNILTPASAITVTLPAPTADGDLIRLVLGAATTVTWAVQAPATAVVIPKTVFAAGESIELVYSAVAGVPTNAAATTWYTH